MPNGGITPDCIHCQLYRGKPHTGEKPFCTLHGIELATPIRAFCSGYVDPEPVDGVDWLDKDLDREKLSGDMMYVWLGGNEAPFFHVPLAPIKDYSQWTYEQFLDELTRLIEKHSKS